MTVTVDFYWDIGSTNTYFAQRLLPGILARTGASVRYYPFNLGYVFRHYNYALTDEAPEKMRYRGQDLRRWADHLQLPFKVPGEFPIKTTRALRGAFVARELGIEEAYMDAIFTAYWEEGVSVQEYAAIQPLVEQLGQDGAAFVERAESVEVKQALIESTTGGLERGVFGAPMFVVGGEMFWGKDRLDFLEREIREQVDAEISG